LGAQWAQPEGENQAHLAVGLRLEVHIGNILHYWAAAEAEAGKVLQQPQRCWWERELRELDSRQEHRGEGRLWYRQGMLR